MFLFRFLILHCKNGRKSNKKEIFTKIDSRPKTTLFNIVFSCFLPVFAPVTIAVFPTKHVGLLSNPTDSFRYNFHTTAVAITITPYHMNDSISCPIVTDLTKLLSSVDVWEATAHLMLINNTTVDISHLGKRISCMASSDKLLVHKSSRYISGCTETAK